jgi:hypothetical protein
MPYVNSDGTVTEAKSWFRLSIFSDVFWSVVNAFGLFFSTLTNPTAPLPSGKEASQYNKLNNTSFNVRPGDSASAGNKHQKPKVPGAAPPKFGAKVAQLPKPACNSGR